MSEPREPADVRHGASDDYLWDPQAPGSPEVVALERLLATFAHDGRPPAAAPWDEARRRSGRPPARRWRWTVLAAAAVLLVWVLWDGGATLAPGAAPRRFVAMDAPRTVELGAVGAVTLQAGSELQFERWAAESLRLRLVRGAIDVRVAPPPAVPPRFFEVSTPRGLVIDLGCRYELRLRDDGDVVVRVSEGLVEFVYPARTVVVPAGALCRVGDGGPSTPRFADVDGRLRDLLAKFDATPVDSPQRGWLAKEVAERCQRGRDTLILWHMLADPAPAIAVMAESRILDLVGELPPGAVPGGKTDPGGQRDELQAGPALWLPFLRLGAWSTAD